ncbi:hypothetical protein KUL42_13750 [Alteromonas sp. KUL42]|uniref:hypothetical protein n=1 Tax=Alteromonas sp. KUL42 TaxID=2480797 RepID=UPI0010357EC9|nr:hypothetical protein [Alteromonas sp. KUL42]TAP37185.1 hypothetical protein EYR97_06795 [Alteromonas sp. KUL42]GEA06614.1 hypothetical protein KUL42_13750 [Alteromonas sp. KUL42]
MTHQKLILAILTLVTLKAHAGIISISGSQNASHIRTTSNINYTQIVRDPNNGTFAHIGIEGANYTNFDEWNRNLGNGGSTVHSSELNLNSTHKSLLENAKISNIWLNYSMRWRTVSGVGTYDTRSTSIAEGKSEFDGRSGVEISIDGNQILSLAKEQSVIAECSTGRSIGDYVDKNSYNFDRYGYYTGISNDDSWDVCTDTATVGWNFISDVLTFSESDWSKIVTHGIDLAVSSKTIDWDIYFNTGDDAREGWINHSTVFSTSLRIEYEELSDNQVSEPSYLTLFTCVLLGGIRFKKRKKLNNYV